MKLPPKRKPQKSGIPRGPQRVWPRHRKFVRGHACSVPGCICTPIEFAHVVSRGAGGHDAFGVSLCHAHHREQHQIGIETFQRRHRIDLKAIAAEFVRRSPDADMRASLRLVSAEEIA